MALVLFLSFSGTHQGRFNNQAEFIHTIQGVGAFGCLGGMVSEISWEGGIF